MNRWTASGTHLILSLLVIGGIAVAALQAWYPWGLHRVTDANRLLATMLGIGIASGPLLTLIVYRPGKRGLAFDLVAIAVLQLASLGYGLYALSQARPVFLVGIGGQFTLVAANELDPTTLADTRPEWRRLPWTGPHLVGARMPDDPDDLHQLMTDFMAGGPGLERTPHRYIDFSEVAPGLTALSHPAHQSGNPDNSARTTSLPPEHVRWVPVVSRKSHGRMLIDPETSHPLRTLAPL